MFKRLISGFTSFVFVWSTLLPATTYAVDKGANKTSRTKYEPKRNQTQKVKRNSPEFLKPKRISQVSSQEVKGLANKIVDANVRAQGFMTRQQMIMQYKAGERHKKLQQKMFNPLDTRSTKFIKYVSRITKTTLADSIFFFLAGFVVDEFYKGDNILSRGARKASIGMRNGVNRIRHVVEGPGSYTQNINSLSGNNFPTYNPVPEAHFFKDPQSLESEAQMLADPHGFFHFFTFIATNNIYGDYTRGLVERGKVDGKAKRFIESKWNGYTSMGIASAVASIVMETGSAVKECTMAKWADAYNYVQMNKGSQSFDPMLSTKQEHIEMCEELLVNFENGKSQDRIVVQIMSLLVAAPLGGYLEGLITKPIVTLTNHAKTVGKLAKGVGTASGAVLGATGKVAAAGVSLAPGGKSAVNGIVGATHSSKAWIKGQSKKLGVKVASRTQSAMMLAKRASGATMLIPKDLIRVLMATKDTAILAKDTALNAMKFVPGMGKVIQFTFFLAAQAMIEPSFEFMYDQINETHYAGSEQTLISNVGLYIQRGTYEETLAEKWKRIKNECDEDGRNCKTDLLPSLKMYAHNGKDYRSNKLAKSFEAHGYWIDYIQDMVTSFEDSKSFYDRVISKIGEYRAKRGSINPFEAIHPVRVQKGEVSGFNYVDESLISYKLANGTNLYDQIREELRDSVRPNFETRAQKLAADKETFSSYASDISAAGSFKLIGEFDRPELSKILDMTEDEFDAYFDPQSGKQMGDLIQVVVTDKASEFEKKGAEYRERIQNELTEEEILIEMAKIDPILALDYQSETDRRLEREMISENFMPAYEKAAGDSFTRGRLLNLSRAYKFLDEKLRRWRHYDPSGRGVVSEPDRERIFLSRAHQLLKTQDRSKWEKALTMMSDRVNSAANKCSTVEISLKGLEESGLSENEFIKMKIIESKGTEYRCVNNFAYQELGFPRVQPYQQRLVEEFVSEIVNFKDTINPNDRPFFMEYTNSNKFGFKTESTAEEYLVDMVCGPKPHDIGKLREYDNVTSAIEKAGDALNLEGNAYTRRFVGKFLPLTSLKFYAPSVVSERVSKQVCKSLWTNPTKLIAPRDPYNFETTIVTKNGNKKTYYNLLDIIADNIVENDFGGPIKCVDGSQSSNSTLSDLPLLQDETRGHPACNYGELVHEFPEVNGVVNRALSEVQNMVAYDSGYGSLFGGELRTFIFESGLLSRGEVTALDSSQLTPIIDNLYAYQNYLVEVVGAKIDAVEGIELTDEENESLGMFIDHANTLGSLLLEEIPFAEYKDKNSLNSLNKWWESKIAGHYNELNNAAKVMYTDTIVKDIVEPSYYGDYKISGEAAPTRFNEDYGVAGSFEAEFNVYMNKVITPIYANQEFKSRNGADLQEVASWKKMILETLHQYVNLGISMGGEQHEQVKTKLLALLQAMRSSAGLADGPLSSRIKQFEVGIAQIKNTPNHPDYEKLPQYEQSLASYRGESMIKLSKVKFTKADKQVLETALVIMEGLVSEVEQYRGLFTDLY